MTWDLVDYSYHRSLRATTSRITFTWLSHGYGLFPICHLMPIISCSLCMLCLFLSLCHVIVTLVCIYPGATILLLCVFACLVEILVAIAIFTMRHMLLLILVLGES